LKRTEWPGNSTHYGPVTLEVLNEIPSVMINVVVESNGRKFIDHTFSMCKLVNSGRDNFLTLALRNYLTLMDYRLFSCPVVAGEYVMLPAREVNFLNDMKLGNKISNVIPAKGIFTLNSKGTTTIDRETVTLAKSTEVYEFLDD
jgi:hypothetical protein